MLSISRRGLLLLTCVIASAFLLSSCQNAPEATPVSGEAPERAPESDLAPVGVLSPEPIEEPAPERPAEGSPKIMRSIVTQADALGFELTPPAIDQKGALWTLRKGDRRLELAQGSREARLDGLTVFLDEPFDKRDGNWLLGEGDARLLLKTIMTERLPRLSHGSDPVIAIDPGHGGKEKGAENLPLGIVEKQLTMDVCLRLQSHLEAMGFKTVLTRYDDRSVALDKRPEIAKRADADLFISVHFNADLNKEANGIETYMLTPAGYPSTADEVPDALAVPYAANGFDGHNFDLAYRIQRKLVDQLQRRDRGVRKARFAVLRDLDCPGVLVEGGFVSHADEALLVRTPVYREKMAKALAEAIQDYFRQ